MSSSLNKIKKDIMSAMQSANKQGTSAYDTTAEVRRVEGDIAWVHIAGGVDETPVKLTIAAKAGDAVQVRVGGGRAWITGNATAPPTDDKKANEAQVSADTAQETANNAKETADEALSKANKSVQFFWTDEDGAHVTTIPQEQFLDNPTGGNALFDAYEVAFRNALSILARFGISGASIGRDGELRFFVTPSSIALENDNDEAIFSVVEGAAGKIVRPAVVVTFTDAADVDTVTRTISDSITASGAVAVFFETGDSQYALDNTLATTTVTAGTGVTIALTQSGVDYCQGLMTESEGSGILSVEYYITHYDKALLDMIGTISVDGVGDIIGVTNTAWTDGNQSDTFIGADNAKTGKGVRVGVGTGGQNRGLYDKTLERWLIYSDSGDNTVINGNNASLSAGGNFAIDGTLSLRTNNRSLRLTDAQGKTVPMIYINGSNAFSLGYGLYDASKGSTIIYGNDISLMSKGAIKSNTSITLDTNNTGITFTDSSGNKYSQIYLSSANNFGVGYNMYDANKGSTGVYGHTLGFYSHNDITFNQPITVNGTVNGRSMSVLLQRGAFSTTTHTAADVNVAANDDSGAKTATFKRSGYYPYAIAGWNLTGTNRMYQNLYEILMTNRADGTVTVTYRFYNNASVAVTIGLQIDILWIQIL